MKNIKYKNGNIIRVSDVEARNLVLSGDYKYCPKQSDNPNYQPPNKDWKTK